MRRVVPAKRGAKKERQIPAQGVSPTAVKLRGVLLDGGGFGAGEAQGKGAISAGPSALEPKKHPTQG